MIERKRFLSLGYYAKAPSFTGSENNKNFKVEKVVDEETGDKSLKATVWPGPFCFDKTDNSLKQIQTAEFSEEGICSLVDWINSIEFETED